MNPTNDNHSFNVNAATTLRKNGILAPIEKAIILKELFNLCSWRVAQKKITFGFGWWFASSESLAEKFPYMVGASIARWVKELEKDGFIFSKNLNKFKYDRTLSYTVNYDAYNCICRNEFCISQREEWILQVDKSIIHNEESNLQDESPIHSPKDSKDSKDYSEVSTSQAPESFLESEKQPLGKSEQLPKVETVTDCNQLDGKKAANKKEPAFYDVYVEVLTYFNSFTGSRLQIKEQHLAARSDMYKQITNLCKTEGATAEILKKIIECKNKEWLGTEQEKYINPKTLFRPIHYENYSAQALGLLKAATPTVANLSIIETPLENPHAEKAYQAICERVRNEVPQLATSKIIMLSRADFMEIFSKENESPLRKMGKMKNSVQFWEKDFIAQLKKLNSFELKESRKARDIFYDFLKNF